MGVFFCSAHWTPADIPILVGNVLLIFWTTVLFLARKDLQAQGKVARKNAKSAEHLQELFAINDSDKDSLLNLYEIKSTFKGIYPRTLWTWQEELILLEYDALVMDGLRVQDLISWYEAED